MSKTSEAVKAAIIKQGTKEFTPGVVSRTLPKITSPTVRYHMIKLEKEGYLSSSTAKGFKVFKRVNAVVETPVPSLKPALVTLKISFTIDKLNKVEVVSDYANSLGLVVTAAGVTVL